MVLPNLYAYSSFWNLSPKCWPVFTWFVTNSFLLTIPIHNDPPQLGFTQPIAILNIVHVILWRLHLHVVQAHSQGGSEGVVKYPIFWGNCLHIECWLLTKEVQDFRLRIDIIDTALKYSWLQACSYNSILYQPFHSPTVWQVKQHLWRTLHTLYIHSCLTSAGIQPPMYSDI